MQYRKFGHADFSVSTIGFGAWAMGGRDWGNVHDQQSKAALKTAIDLGVNFIDTADVYGFGHSESLITAVLSGEASKEVTVATKAGNDFYNATSDDDVGYGPYTQNYKKQYLMDATNRSMERLERDSLDILQLHSPDTEWLREDDPWDALTELKSSGKIRRAGWSIQSFKEEEQAVFLEEYHSLIDCVQVRYNLLERDAEKFIFPITQRYDIAAICRIPLLFGFLTGKFNRSTRFSEDDHRRFNLSPDKLDSYYSALDEAQYLFDEYSDQSMAQVSLRFCLTHPAATVAIPGAKTTKQVRDNCQASDLGPIPADLIPPLD